MGSGAAAGLPSSCKSGVGCSRLLTLSGSVWVDLSLLVSFIQTTSCFLVSMCGKRVIMRELKK